MALTMKIQMNDSKELFKKLLPFEAASLLNTLIKNGVVKPQFGFHNISFHYGKGQVLAETLPLSIPTLQSSATTSSMVKIAGAKLLPTVDELFESIGFEKTSGGDYIATTQSAVEALQGPGMLQLSKNLDVAAGDTLTVKLMQPTPENFAEPAKLTNADFGWPEKAKKAQEPVDMDMPVKLLHAKVLRQPVTATTAGVRYHVAALSERVKLAIRVRDTANERRISFRIEGTPTPEEEQKLFKAKMVKNKGYYSMHMDVPALTSQEETALARPIGAFLFGLGIKFDEQIQQFSDLPVEKS